MKFLVIVFSLLLLLLNGCDIPNSVTNAPVTIPEDGSDDDNGDEESDNPLYHLMAERDEAFIWTIAEPQPPSPLNGEYHHMRFDFPEGYKKSASLQRMAISANGSRIAVMARSSSGAELFLFSPESQTPLLQVSVPYHYSVDISKCGRGMLTFGGLITNDEHVLRFFQTDFSDPVWEWNPDEYERKNLDEEITKVNFYEARFSADGNHIVCTYSMSVGDNNYKTLVFGTGNPAPLYEICSYSQLQPSVAVSEDGSSIMIITDNDSNVDSYETIQSISFYKNGALQWTDEVPVSVSYSSLLVSNPKACIADNGNTAAMIGGCGQVIKYDTSTGSRLLSYTELVYMNSADNDILEEIKISQDGEKISVLANENGIVYFDGSSTPEWRSIEHLKAYLDLSSDRNPTPNGFEVLFEEGFGGFCSQKYSSSTLPSFLYNLQMSSDGNVMLLCSQSWNDTDEEGGHLYLFSGNSPLPFQILTENGQTDNDSMFVEGVLSSDGAWTAGIAENYDMSNLRIHIFENPPGIIADVSTPVTLSVSGTAGEILDYASDVDEANITWQVVKPGRAADLTVEMNHTNLSDELFGGLNFPWEDTHRSRELSWGDGFVSETISMDWETPTNLSSAALALQTIVLRGELFSSSDVLLSQSYDEYLSINVNISE